MKALVYLGPMKKSLEERPKPEITAPKGWPAVTTFKPGDRVLISCISACAKCVYCRKLMYSHCTTGGWILGNSVDGTQAGFVRVPYADTSLYRIPDGADEEALVMLK